ncbi:hypothetical protein THRCLA_07335 [Thraustotheca clavata]|uniref:Conserved Oligomeric Golgi complex subunit 6 C-terminal domain-containing protein n=1 Tax=Thraustotheca clavata TaxID=74557 RepID=A0A1V9ZE72_9STRA|nr:hypothetical protein THRCLA_07335 [Thraustotheca clavata]
MHEERADFSLAATHSTMDITHKLAGLLDIYRTALLPNGPQVSDIALFLDGFLKTLHAVSKNRHADISDSLVFQINQLGHVHATLTRYDDLTSQWNVELHQELFGSLQSLALMQAAIILKRCAAAALIERLNNTPDNASTQPGLDEGSVKIIVHNFCTCLMSLSFPSIERITQPDLRDQAYTATAKQLSDAYAMLYQLVCDPRCGYTDPTSIVLKAEEDDNVSQAIGDSMAVAADYSGWVKELNEFKPSISDDEDEDEDERVDSQALASQYMEPSRRRSSSSQMEEIKQEMKLLNWHKLANEAALKAALIKTKKLKREDARHTSVYEAEERLERLQQIQEEESMKPLEVTADFIRQYEEEERREEIRLEQKVARHINCLKKLKTMIAEREELRLRHLRYRDGKQALEKKLAIMNGNQEEDQLRDLSRGRLTPRSLSQGSSEVSKALSSLDKLVELERRISCLEQSSLSPPSTAAAILPPSAAKAALKFTKSSTGRPTAHQVAKRPPKKTQTFLTAVPEPKRQVSKQVQRASELRRMPERDRQKAQRMDRRQEEEKKQKLQNIKINQWMDKKKQAANSRKTNNIKATMRTTAAKPTTNNPHMAQFLSMKKQFEAKKASFTASKPTPPPTKRTPPVRSNKANVKPSTDRLLPLIHNRSAKPPPKNPKPSAIVSTTLPSLELGISGIRKPCR